MHVQALLIDDPQYPVLLKQIYDPPQILYYVGNLEILRRPLCAVVGTRRMTRYGEMQAFRFAKELSRQGVCVVSGLAYGIDKAAHEGALAGLKGGTVAILAQGLPDIQPSRHRHLARQIIETGGLLLSEKTAGAITFKSDYLVRNRLISGISKVTLVIEAPFKSGAMNTAKHAEDQNRDVLALPGRIADTSSQGTNLLIQRGAKLVISPREVLEAMGLNWTGEKVRLDGLDATLFEELKKSPQTPAELCEKFKDVAEVYSTLVHLELRGLIRCGAENHYAVSSGS